MLEKYKSWSKSKRVNAALAAYESGAETVVSQLARNYGVDRTHLQRQIKKRKAEAESQVERDRAASLAKLGLAAAGMNETRRVPGDFEEFSNMYFGHFGCPDCDDVDGNPKIHEMPGFHKELIHASYDPDVRRLLINLPPFHSKTTVISVRRTIHQIVKDPNYRALIVSLSQPFAQLILQGISEHLTNPDLYTGSARNLVEDWGPFRRDTSVWNKEQIFVAGRITAEKDPTVQVLGIGSQIYGRRADEIIFDDVVDVDRSRNPETVEKDLSWIDKMALSRIGKKGRAIWVGTRVYDGDIYSKLAQRNSYRVMNYPAILDEATSKVLWPDHFPMEQVLIQRDEMLPRDFQLVYQQVALAGAGSSFTEEMIEAIKDPSRGLGHFEGGWQLVAGVDLAGAGAEAGYTAMVLLGVDLETGRRHIIDVVNVKSMKAPQIFDQMESWAEIYPLSEFRVEANSLQSQIVQYNQEINERLAKHGVRVVPHVTQRNKWDPIFGVETLAPLFQNGFYSLPWMNANSRERLAPLVEQALAFPYGVTTDLMMALWIADLAARDRLQRANMPLFDARRRVPQRIARRRHVVDFAAGELHRVPEHMQSQGHLMGVGRNMSKRTVGRPVPHEEAARERVSAEDPMDKYLVRSDEPVNV